MQNIIKILGKYFSNSGIGQVENQKMIKDKLIVGKKIVNRFRGKLVKMIKNSCSKYDDYSISPKIRQILLHWDYELTEKNFELSN